MHLLYLDDSGSPGNPGEEYFVLGGLSVFEGQVHWFISELDQLAKTICPESLLSVEFHASEIFSGRKAPWSAMTKPQRKNVILQVLAILQRSYDSARTFACAIHKPSFPNADPVEIAFEDLSSRFDLYLERLYAAGDRQRGLIILDESSYETTLQGLARRFRDLGTRWGAIRHLSDVPMTVDSKAS